jgi:hypothetical protein
MGKKTPEAPKPVDPVASANAQAQANIASATAQQRMNMIGTAGPDGTVRYEADPTQPGGYNQVTTLSPDQQRNYDLNNQIYGQTLGIGQDQLGRISTALGQGLTPPELQSQIGGNFDQTVNAARDAAYGQATSRLDPQFATRENQMRTQLANQGLGQNSAAYQNAQDAFGRERNDAYSSARNDAFGQGLAAQNQGFNQSGAMGTFANTAAQQGFQNQATEQNQPINQLSGLLGLGQVAQPNGISYAPTQVGQTDVLGAQALNQQGQWNRYNAQTQAQNSTMQGLFGLGSAALTTFSDVRLKKNIVHLGTRPDGLGVYAYDYLWDGPRQIGVMAQEVQRIKPEAVREIGGYLAVDYGRL